MKKHLGDLLLILFFAHISLYANNLASYNLIANKHEAFVKEPIKITFFAKQKDNTDHMFFLLKPKSSALYKIKLLKKVINDKKYHSSTTSFTYILFPLKAGNIKISFDFIIQTASDKAVAQSFVEDHDDNIGIQTSNKKISLAPILLTIKALAQPVDLVGDFHLQSKIDTQEISQYNDVNLLYTLQGSGYMVHLKYLLPSTHNVTMFSDVQTLSSKLTQNGYSVKKEYNYALSAKKNFLIPSVVLKAYSPSLHQFYTLKIPSYKIKVTQINPETLLDKNEVPQEKRYLNFISIEQFISYIFIFLSGFFVAKITNVQFTRKKKEKKYLDIKESQSPKELILVLLNNYNNKDINPYIAKLEKLQYSKESQWNFKDIKMALLEEIM